jgi:hypothetical protein
MFRFTALAAVVLLAACEPAPVETLPPVSQPQPYVDPLAPQPGGLEERQPDTCKAVDYIGYLGQPGTVIPTLIISRPFRVVEWRGIEAQEYNPQRLVFRLDAAGNIFNIDCG